MRPIFFEFELPVLGLVTFPAYMTMLMLGFLVAVFAARRQAERDGLPGQTIVDLGILMLVLGIAGARLLAVLTDGKLVDFVHLCTEPTLVEAVDSRVPYCDADLPCDFHYVCEFDTHTCHPPRDCLAALKFWQGGLTYYGGLLAAVPGGLWYARKKRLDPMQVADLAAPLVMLGLFVGRLGCFFNGCCYGARTESWLGVQFPGHSQAVHPTQLYEAFGVLGLYFLLATVIRPRKRGHGEVFGWLLVLYGTLRMAIELVRADQRGSFGPLSTSQWISIPLIIAGIWLVVRVRTNALAAQREPSRPQSGDNLSEPGDQLR
ncbi:MAG: prolipoprotein diacylglyceryl transferase [Proteobacteria bacterium]|nr:prolipoprotein diacylglyceryl transferase [Pseudomonadota bacterium]